MLGGLSEAKLVQQMGGLAIDLHTVGGGTLACSEARMHAANTRPPWVPFPVGSWHMTALQMP